MVMEIILSDVEQKFVQYVAKQRYLSNRENGVYDAKVGDQSNEQTDVDGFGAEVAFAKAINAYPDFSISPRSGGFDLISPKGKKIDVKQTRYHNGKLLATIKKGKEEDGADIFVLVIGTFPRFTAVGWCYRDELIKPENIRDLGHGDTYAMLQYQLREDFEEL